MDLTSAKAVKKICLDNNFKPSRSSGQNFLVSQYHLNEIVRVADIKNGNKVLEIGPGLGVLTKELLIAGAEVFAVELDTVLFNFLQKNFKNGKLHLYNGDIFQIWSDIKEEFKDGQFKIVSNLPYNITSKVLRFFLDNTPRPADMTLLLQREVAERIVAKVRRMSILSVAVQFFGNPKITSLVASKNFWPKPDVDSAIIKISDIGGNDHDYLKQVGEENVENFFKVVRTGFSSRRKQLHNNLSAGFGINNTEIKKYLDKIGLNVNIRAQELSINQWIELNKNINKL